MEVVATFSKPSRRREIAPWYFGTGLTKVVVFRIALHPPDLRASHQNVLIGWMTSAFVEQFTTVWTAWTIIISSKYYCKYINEEVNFYIDSLRKSRTFRLPHATTVAWCVLKATPFTAQRLYNYDSLCKTSTAACLFFLKLHQSCVLRDDLYTCTSDCGCAGRTQHSNH